MRSAFVALVFGGWVVGLAAQDSRATSRPVRVHETVVAGLRVVHVAGPARARSQEFGRRYAAEIVTLVRTEFHERFSRREGALALVRERLPKLIRFPAELVAEIEGMWAGIVAAAVDLALPDFERSLDRRDLEVVNALDVFATMACSGFTAAGDEVEGGGVLTTRNFDWPYTGRHLVENAMLLVVHPEEGHAQAFLTWPGYLGAVTGFNAQGLAVFLHVGSGTLTFQPRAGSCPTAAAAREILRRAGTADAIAVAREEVRKTSPPASYLTRVIVPDVVAGRGPEFVFEADSTQVVLREEAGRCVTTNHFLARDDGRSASGDSLTRCAKIRAQLARLVEGGDHKISLAEAWDALVQVQRSGLGYGTLHSVVFRAKPWALQIALGVPRGERDVRAAPGFGVRVSVPEELVFGERGR